MSVGSGIPQADIAAYAASRVEGYCNIAAVALLLYDACITFDMEVKHIWQRKVSAATWIFLLNRYLVIALYIIDTPSTFQVSNESCPVLVRLSQVLDILPYVVWASFSSLRVYALCSRAWHVALAILLLSSAPVWVYVFRDVHKHAVNYSPPYYCRTVAGYPVGLDRPLTVVGRSCLILSDLLVLSVTWSQTYGIMRLSRKHRLDVPFPLTTVLLRDGSAYFMIWTILNALHIAGTYVDSIRYITGFTEAATSILAARFILNLREVASPPLPEDMQPDLNAYRDFAGSWHVACWSHSRLSDASSGVKSFLAPVGAPLEHSSTLYRHDHSQEYAASSLDIKANGQHECTSERSPSSDNGAGKA